MRKCNDLIKRVVILSQTHSLVGLRLVVIKPLVNSICVDVLAGDLVGVHRN